MQNIVIQCINTISVEILTIVLTASCYLSTSFHI